MSGVDAAVTSSLHRAFVNFQTLVKGNTLAQRRLSQGSWRWWNPVAVCISRCRKARAAKAEKVCSESGFT